MYTPGYVEPETPGEQTRREKACAFFATSEAECDEGIGEWRMPLVYEVIEPSGRYLGLSFPNRQTELGFARGRHVWVVETGAFGESYVVRYRIAGGVEKAGQPPPARPMVKNSQRRHSLQPGPLVDGVERLDRHCDARRSVAMCKEGSTTSSRHIACVGLSE
jgi:hypothetical protein